MGAYIVGLAYKHAAISPSLFGAVGAPVEGVLPPALRSASTTVGGSVCLVRFCKNFSHPPEGHLSFFGGTRVAEKKVGSFIVRAFGFTFRVFLDCFRSAGVVNRLLASSS